MAADQGETTFRNSSSKINGVSQDSSVLLGKLELRQKC